MPVKIKITKYNKRKFLNFYEKKFGKLPTETKVKEVITGTGKQLIKDLKIPKKFLNMPVSSLNNVPASGVLPGIILVIFFILILFSVQRFGD